MHTILDELQLPVEEVIIDLDTPRSAEYLAINPRGLVPTLSYNGTNIVESGIISIFLTDLYPSHLVPAGNTEDGALARTRISFFVDAYFNKFQSQLNKLYATRNAEEAQPIIDAAVAALTKEIEPLLPLHEGAGSSAAFFGDSDRLTLAEALTGPFVIRLVTLAKAGLFPAELQDALREKTPNFWKWAGAVTKHPSVTKIFSKDHTVEFTKKRIAKARAAASAAA